MQSVIERQLGPGWIAGDTSYSTALPGGREAFVFSDTLIGTAQPSGAARVTGVADSSELVGTLPYLATDCAGTYDAPAALIPDLFDSDATWQTASTYMEGGNQLIFVNAYDMDPGSPFDRYTGRSGIAVMSVPPGGMPTFASVTLLPTDPATQWGNAVMQSGGYTYVYGSDLDPATGTVYGMKIARVPVGESLDTGAWGYWNGSQWVGGESNAVVVPTVNQLTGVVPDPSGYGFVAVSVPNSVYTDTTVDLSFASSPTVRGAHRSRCTPFRRSASTTMRSPTCPPSTPSCPRATCSSSRTTSTRRTGCPPWWRTSTSTNRSSWTSAGDGAGPRPPLPSLRAERQHEPDVTGEPALYRDPCRRGWMA